MKKILTLGFCSVFAFMVSGCETYEIVENKQLVSEPDRVALRISEAASTASLALETLAAVEQTRNPGVYVAGVTDAPRELRRTMSLTWAGPIEPVAERLADRAGYEFATIGATPPVPIVVNVNATEKPLIDMLRDLGLQAGSRADVIVDAERRIVEINYAPLSDG